MNKSKGMSKEIVCHHGMFHHLFHLGEVLFGMTVIHPGLIHQRYGGTAAGVTFGVARD